MVVRGDSVPVGEMVEHVYMQVQLCEEALSYSHVFLGSVSVHVTLNQGFLQP